MTILSSPAPVTEASRDCPAAVSRNFETVPAGNRKATDAVNGPADLTSPNQSTFSTGSFQPRIPFFSETRAPSGEGSR